MIAVLLLLLLLLPVVPGAGAGLLAQWAPSGDPHAVPGAPGASTFLDERHWLIGAVRRLDGLGLLPDREDWSEAMLTRGSATRLVRRAVEEAGRIGSPHASLALAYRARLEEEFGPLLGDGGDGGTGRLRWRAETTGGVERTVGRVAAGIGYPSTDWTGARPLPDEGGGYAGMNVEIEGYRHFALAVEGRYGESGGTLGRVQWVATGKGAGVWLGRRSVAWGSSPGSGIVFAGGERLAGGGFFLPEPVRLPGLLEHLGPIRFDAFLTRVRNGRDRDRHWLSGMRLSGQPHPRLVFGLNRAMMFAGGGALDWIDYASMLVGKHPGEAGENDNQLASVDLRYRAPAGDLPVTLFLEWGFEDSSGAWRDVPGRVAGVELAALPGVPGVAVRLERAWFSASCCGNPMWYRNWSLQGGWTNDGRLLGHPLGGHGAEWSAAARADLFDARLRVDGRAYRRRRGEENVVSPDREGHSTGGELRLEARPDGRLDLSIGGSFEAGSGGWREHAGFATVRWLVPGLRQN